MKESTSGGSEPASSERGCRAKRAPARAGRHLVLAVVLLGMPQHPVAQAEHVLVGGVLLVRQLLQPHQGPLTPLVTERSLQNAKDLGEQGE